MHVLEFLKHFILARSTDYILDKGRHFGEDAIDQPFKSSVFTNEQLKEYAKQLAHIHETSHFNNQYYYSMLSSLNNNKVILNNVHKSFTKAIQDDQNLLPPSTEWLLDNYYIVDDQIASVKYDLTLGFYKDLPKLKIGHLRGFPRIYSIALELLTHSDSRLTQEVINEFIFAYESVSPLTSAELWAFPIMLRLVLIENLKRIMEKSEDTFQKRKTANVWGERLVSLKGLFADQIFSELGKTFKSNKNPDPLFLIWVLRSLRDKDSSITPIIHWLEKYIEQEDINLEEIVKVENQRQASYRVSTGNIITSMRLISSLDWSLFFETTSLVEKILRQDPAAVYEHMDFASRDNYRHSVENISRYSRFNEQEVARRAIKLATKENAGKSRHVGFYLINKGLSQLKADCVYLPTPTIRIKEFILKYPVFFYLTSIFAITGTLLSLVSLFFGFIGIFPLISLISLITISVPAVSIVNNTITRLFPPLTPPKFEFKDGVPDEFRTTVVIPWLIGNENDVLELISKIEKGYLANRDKNITFALLSDFPDAQQKDMPGDLKLTEKIKLEINKLNNKYVEDSVKPFYLFHRERSYNQREKTWMGRERKRGKLEEFNRFLLTGVNTSFTEVVGDIERAKTTKFVITLDQDTLIPLNTAKKMIGTIAHPLNRAVIDEFKNMVIEGYGIIQPRVDTFAPSATKTEFTKLFSPESGLDPYHSVVSNVYQDFFQNASYIGKAIYDLEAYHKCLNGKFPENTLLSHDLLEGNYLRVGLASDIELLEDFPVSYDSYSRRQHRWIRGDWQTIPWLLPWVKTESGKKIKNTLGALEKWKIVDNLRRSLVIPLGTLLIIFGLFAFPRYADLWTLIVLSATFFSLIQFFAASFSASSIQGGIANYGTNLWGDINLNVKRFIILVSLMAYETYRNLNAIFLALLRVTFRLRGTLEWTCHAVAELKHNWALTGYVKRMYVPVGLSLFVCLWWVLKENLYSLPTLTLLLFTISPVVSYFISHPINKVIQTLEPDEKVNLAITARKIWRFFDEHANSENNFLPPDNLQISPGPKLAKRTSPTNIGFLLLSLVSAYDFGFINKDDLLSRLERVFLSLEKLDKYNGHFFNWYQTDTLQRMHPAYISTVDSGNLAACLIVIKQTCLEMMNIEQNNHLQEGLLITFEAWREEWGLISKNNKLNANKNQRRVNEIVKIAQHLISESKTKIQTGKPTSKLLLVNELGEKIKKCETRVEKLIGSESVSNLMYWRNQIALNTSYKAKEKGKNNKWADLANKSEQMVRNMDFRFLFDLNRKVFSIGFNTDENTLDESYYNLIASEARLASFLAISLGQIPEKHWFDLGRPLKKIKGKPVLLSWGGTIFEYLMPELFIRNYENTLLSETNDGILERQIDYAKAKKIPWGISESGFFAFDFNYNYQYQQFGVPDLSLKMTASENLVVAPYASLLALPFRPRDVFDNLKKLELMGTNGTYGYFEAVDFNPERVKENDDYEVVQTYMAHHQGMGLVAINNYFNAGIMQSRFHMDEHISAVELLLSERVPQHIAKVVKSKKEIILPSRDLVSEVSTAPTFSGKTETIKTTVLSNSEYTVAVTNGGTGFSSYKNTDITRWQSDMVENNWGWFCFIKDSLTKVVWSATYQPYLKKPDNYLVSFLPHKAEFFRTDNKIETKTTVVVVPDVNVEIREVSLTNKSNKTTKLEITDYAEVVGLKHRDDAFNQALGKLFMESEYDPKRQALIYKRRSRLENQPELWIWHTVSMDKEKAHVFEYETNRETFIGRGKTILQARAFTNPLGNFSGASLDPIMSLRTKLILKKGETRRLFFITGATESKQTAQDLIDKFSETGEVERGLKLAEIHSHIELRHLGIKTEEARYFQKLGSRIIYPDRYSRARENVLVQNVKGQAGLYPYGISGDYPIVLVKIKSKDGLKLIRQTLLAHEFLRMKNIYFDLVILNEQNATYAGDLKEAIHSLIDTSLSRPLVDKPGGIFLRDSAFITKGDQILFETIARIVLDSQLGNLADAFDLAPRSDYEQVNYELERKVTEGHAEQENKINSGNFSRPGNEYLISSDKGELPPYPWSNIISNPNFGTLLTSAGLGYTWSGNSQLNRITTWSNDPVTEKPGEILYIRDNQNLEWFSATPLPNNNFGKYETTHGWGYSSYVLKDKDISLKTDVWVDQIDPVKIISVNISNTSKKARTVKPLYYAELVMGDNREQNQFFIVSQFDIATGALVAKNSYNDLYPQNITFAFSSESEIKYSADRMEFIGRGGSWSRPSYLESDFENELSGNVGAGLDPSIILETSVTLPPGSKKQLIFVLGQAKSQDEYLHLTGKYKNISAANDSLNNVKQNWKKRLNTIQIKTPNTSLNTIANGWLVYQALSGRFWGRTSFFQSGGAFGFRDQLQDLLGLMYSDPEIVRSHILYTAQHQFIQGDVMHWWHPDTTRGVRTRISDDFLWLPYIVSQYIKRTNDTGILDEMVSFMDMAPLMENQIEKYDSAVITQEKSSIFDHCIRALENGMKVGKHGLPLIGSGDWNDGLNSVGEGGAGESVWLAWFQYAVYQEFSQISKERENKHNALRYQRYARLVKEATEKHGWDGNWYRRAYFDDGSILGSSENDEDIIDSVSQTWSVISGADTGIRAKMALDSVEQNLVKEKDGLILLLTPPFEKSTPFPGYIRGYIPGIRENGSQYTHAAVWLPLAYAMLGDGNKAVALLDLINPINHTDTLDKVNIYKGEPYVLAGDVYNHPQHIGRAGWSWYTGSAAWMYKIIIEDVLGLTQSGNYLSFNPCVPESWANFEIKYNWKESVYNIKFVNINHVVRGVKSLSLDKNLLKKPMIKMVNDKKTHEIEVVMGE